MKSIRNRTFGILTLLVAVTWIAAAIAGYQFGFKRGMRAAAMAEEFVSVTYDVEHLTRWLEPSEQPSDYSAYNSLAELIQNTVDDPSVGHEHTPLVTVFPLSRSLIVNDTLDTQFAVSDLLEKLDSLQKRFSTPMEAGVYSCCIGRLADAKRHTKCSLCGRSIPRRIAVSR